MATIGRAGLWFGLGVLAPDDVVLQGRAFAHPHSLYLASALQGGLVGLLLLLGVLLVAGFNLYRVRWLEEARLGLALLAAGMSAYLLGRLGVDRQGERQLVAVVGTGGHFDWG